MMILYLIFASPLLSAACFFDGLLLLRRGNRRRTRAWPGILMLLAAIGFAWLWMEYLLGGLIGRLIFWCIVILSGWLIARHLRQTGRDS